MRAWRALQLRMVTWAGLSPLLGLQQKRLRMLLIGGRSKRSYAAGQRAFQVLEVRSRPTAPPMAPTNCTARRSEHCVLVVVLRALGPLQQRRVRALRATPRLCSPAPYSVVGRAFRTFTSSSPGTKQDANACRCHARSFTYFIV
ncbi:uncharacterized protein LOC144167316 [Haemaphysalis longicornis]